MNSQTFQEIVWEKGCELYRNMPWRDEPTLYHVLVSELMLQQTQVSRVMVKFEEFMRAFPTIESLARATLADVLKMWQGLGYNRRAKFLHQAARAIVSDGVPTTVEALVALPGIGPNTAAAIMNYVYQTPTPFVETNIRTVYFHHFFEDRHDISDKQILALVEETMDYEHPREWFWALMDYGADLKRQGLGRLQTSRHYKKQSPLKGSVRQVRGQIVRALSERGASETILRSRIDADERFLPALEGLIADGLVEKSGETFHLTGAR